MTTLDFAIADAILCFVFSVLIGTADAIYESYFGKSWRQILRSYTSAFLVGAVFFVAGMATHLTFKLAGF